MPTPQGMGMHPPLDHPYFRLQRQVWGWAVLRRATCTSDPPATSGEAPSSLWGAHRTREGAVAAVLHRIGQGEVGGGAELPRPAPWCQTISLSQHVSVLVRRLPRPLVSRVCMGAPSHGRHWPSLATLQLSLSREFSDGKHNPQAVRGPLAVTVTSVTNTLSLRSVQFSQSVVSDSLWPHGLQHATPPCPSPSPGVHSNPCPLSRDDIQPSHPLSSSRSPLALNLSQYRVFSNESVLRIRWPKYWSFSFSMSPSNEHPGLISFRMDWLDLLAVQRTLKSLFQHHSSKASILQRSAFFIVQLSHPYMTTGKTIALTQEMAKVLKLLQGTQDKNRTDFLFILQLTK